MTTVPLWNQRCLVEYCYGKPEPVVRLFQHPHVRDAFHRSFASGDPGPLRREVDEVLRWNDETGGLGRLDYNLALELAGFRAVFDRLVDRTRTAAGTRMERGLGDVHRELSRLVERLDRMESPEEIVRWVVRDSSPAEALAGQLREWFAAVDYRITAEPAAGPDDFVWLLKVPGQRRGWSTVLLLGVGAELGSPEVARAAELVREHGADEGWAVAPQRVSRAAGPPGASGPACRCWCRCATTPRRCRPSRCSRSSSSASTASSATTGCSRRSTGSAGC